MMVFIGKVKNYMFRPKAVIFKLTQLKFCSKSVIYMHIYSIAMSILHRHIHVSKIVIFDNLKIAVLGRNM